MFIRGRERDDRGQRGDRRIGRKAGSWQRCFHRIEEEIAGI
jgi:hypothetical protein